jgi:hypothetical protein
LIESGVVRFEAARLIFESWMSGRVRGSTDLVFWRDKNEEEIPAGSARRKRSFINWLTGKEVQKAT